MALFDYFKKFIKKEKREEKKKLIKKAERKAEKPKPPKKKESLIKRKEAKEKKEEKPIKEKKVPKITFGKADVKEAYKILELPHITEKATNLNSQNQYVFKVKPKANKSEIKKVIQGLYSVRVTGVRIINIPRKRRRLGRTEGYKAGYKKAIVSLRRGDKIEVLPH